MLAVHLGAVLTPAASAAGFALLVPLLAWSIRGVTDDEIGRLGVMSAAFFVASQVHFPTGAGSVHLLLNGVAGVVLGGRAPIALTVGLVLQALLFAHGSLASLGANAVVYCFPAILARPLLDITRRLPAFPRGATVGAAVALLTIAGSAATLALGGEDSVRAAAPLALAFNLPVVVVEAVAVGFLVSYLSMARPEMLGAGTIAARLHPFGSGKISSNGTSH